MKLLCIAALVLSAAAARPDSWRPWRDEKFPPFGEPKQDEDSELGDDELSVTHTPEDGDGGSGIDWPEWDSGYPVWTDEMPTQMEDDRWYSNMPTERPANGNPQGPMTGTDGRPQISPRGKRQLGRRFSRPKGPPRGRWPNRGNPDPLEFSTVFKVDNVTFQNVTDVTLKEGENVFWMQKYGRRGHHHHHKGGKHEPPKIGFQQYVKLIYNATEPNKVSIEYGVLKPMNLRETDGQKDNWVEDY